MNKRNNPRYQQIAADVAAKIASKHYKEGEKIYARSSLASQYGVSAETARRAISILTEHEIVKTTQGSGIIITSSENAINFLHNYQDVRSINYVKDEIIDIIEKINNDNQLLKQKIMELHDKSERFKTINPFIPFEVMIDEKVKIIGKTLSEVKFWKNTKATIIGIKHNEILSLSPGPNAIIELKDTIYFIGDENCPLRVNEFLYNS